MTQPSGRAEQRKRQDKKTAGKSGLDVIHSIIGNDQRTGRTIKLLWHAAIAVCMVIFALGLVIFVAQSGSSAAISGLGTGVVGVAVYLLRKKWRKRRTQHDS